MPSIGQFIDWCNSYGKPEYPPLEVLYAEIQEFIRTSRKDTWNLHPFLYHTITKNLDFYNYKNFDREYDRQKSFETAYKATLFQLEMGENLVAPPNPETLIEQKKPPAHDPSDREIKQAEVTLKDILSMFDEKPEVKNEDNELAKQRLAEATEKLK